MAKWLHVDTFSTRVQRLMPLVATWLQLHCNGLRGASCHLAQLSHLNVLNAYSIYNTIHLSPQTCRNGLLYVIQLLIAHNADPTLLDVQGYNSLHLVTHSSNVMPLLYMLQQPVAVDSVDAQGHTALMWACYQGDAISVDIILKHGASLQARDATGLTPLHWAVVRGNRFCIKQLIEAGADLHAKDDSGKTPHDLAVEIKSVEAYKSALEEAGYTEVGSRKVPLLNDRNTKLAIFSFPLIFFFGIFTTVSIMPWYTGVPLAAAEFFGMHHVVTRVILNKNDYTDSVVQSPYFASIIGASIFWVGYIWITQLAPNTQGYAFTHLIFVASLLLCSYNFFRSVTLDPGTCPKPSSESELRSIIEDLASAGRLNGQTFCVDCMARKPLRSRHCRVCKKCIGKFDHHCPWVWNCVGVNNHRQFMIFVITLIMGISSFDYLTLAYIDQLPPLPPSPPGQSTICDVHPFVCAASGSPASTFTLAVALWATLQLTWTSILLLGQLLQIGRQMTTWEVSNVSRFGFMGGKGGASMAMQQGHQHASAAAQLGASGEEDDPTGGAGPATPGHSHGHGHGHSHGHGHGHGHGHSHKMDLSKGCFGFILRLLGLDRFTRGSAASTLLARPSSRPGGPPKNPFDLGVIANCMDFWTKGGEVGVRYEAVYDVPPEGFKAAKVRAKREADEREEDAASMMGSGGKRRGSTASRYLPAWLANMRKPAANPYQAIAMTEEV
ncbi:hypothetical protein DL93DRAFT_1583077 [Clavulina sp. PMI_390]|nr:hypothetical protein DL93DRAFT_1583077 [Clavulina sp. PMI_390]